MGACDLLISDIHHTRHGPKSHFLARRGFSIWIDLDCLAQANSQSWFFSVGRFNIVSFSEADYGPNFGKKADHISLASYVRKIANQILPNAQVSTIRLLTFPRILGLSFNPLSVYVAQNNCGNDLLYIYEVRNTFGDMHAYIGAPSGGNCILEAQKILHVSPFFPVLGKYRLRIRHDDNRIRLAMRYLIEQKPALTATMRGRLRPLDTWSLVQSLWHTKQWPLRPIASIHLEATKLWFKRLQFYKRPTPPDSAWSQAHD